MMNLLVLDIYPPGYSIAQEEISLIGAATMSQFCEGGSKLNLYVGWYTSYLPLFARYLIYLTVDARSYFLNIMYLQGYLPKTWLTSWSDKPDVTDY